MTKAGEYALAGIPEYWLIDPETERVTVYVLSPDSETYRLVAEYRSGQQAVAETLTGFALRVDELFQG